MGWNEWLIGLDVYLEAMQSDWKYQGEYGAIRYATITIDPLSEYQGESAYNNNYIIDIIYYYMYALCIITLATFFSSAFFAYLELAPRLGNSYCGQQSQLPGALGAKVWRKEQST